ncbi:MAG TPA: hypothetical protein VFQ00_10115 [Terriglobales bacterium]|nr:hypothetical protein [Terriglobales bacterium]
MGNRFSRSSRDFFNLALSAPSRISVSADSWKLCTSLAAGTGIAGFLALLMNFLMQLFDFFVRRLDFVMYPLGLLQQFARAAGSLLYFAEDFVDFVGGLGHTTEESCRLSAFSYQPPA